MTSPTATSPPVTSPAHVPRYIKELDGVRGIAALTVLFHHLCHSTIPLGLASGWSPWVSRLWSLTESWTFGVDLFFVLSGFLITSVLLENRHSRRYYQDFYWKRTLRILPLYVICLGTWYAFNRNLAYTALAATFLVNFASVFHVQGVSVFWTLSIEEQFYLLWPTVVRRRTVRQLRRWAVALILSAVLLRVLFALRGHHNYYLTFLRWDTLAAGALLACHVHSAGKNGEARHRWDRRLAAGALTGLTLAALLSMHPVTPMADAWAQTAVTLLAFSAVGLAVSFSGAAALAPLRSRLLTFFGLISYALYMVHLFILEAYDHLFGAPTPATQAAAYWLRIAVVLAVSVVISVLSRYLVELPSIRLRSFVLSKPARLPGLKHRPQRLGHLWAPPPGAVK